ncbi:MAG: DUF5335 family protein [Acidimicrobiia bacterium]
MSNTRQVPRDSFSSLDRLLPQPNTVDVTMEIVGDEVGDQLEADRVPWHGLIYDPTNDVIEVSAGERDDQDRVSLRHEIHQPDKVWLEEVDGAVKSLSIESGAGPRTILRFHRRSAIGGKGAGAS